MEAWVSPNAPRLIQLLTPEEFCRQIAGRRIEDISRRGKYLLFHLDNGLTWAVHLRMTGRLLYERNACPETPYLRATFRLDDGSWLCFVDLRKFGTMWLVDEESLVTAKLGPDALSEEFTSGYLQAVLKRRSAPVKAALLDQQAMAGIGNIYADEALWRAELHPLSPAGSMKREHAERLVEGIVEALEFALEHRGASIDDYRDARGEKGSMQDEFLVHNREGEACLRGDGVIRRIVVSGRSAYFCPGGCQQRLRRRPRRRRARKPAKQPAGA